LIMGGDHSIGFPTVRGIASVTSKNIGIIHIDRCVSRLSIIALYMKIPLWLILGSLSLAFLDMQIFKVQNELSNHCETCTHGLIHKIACCSMEHRKGSG
jgi:hypothetical protein